MTQKQLILRYVEEHGSITPAKMSGVIYLGKMFGSETSRRCRELREDGKLRSEAKGKFERYFINDIYSEVKEPDMPSGVCVYVAQLLNITS